MLLAHAQQSVIDVDDDHDAKWCGTSIDYKAELVQAVAVDQDRVEVKAVRLASNRVLFEMVVCALAQLLCVFLDQTHYRLRRYFFGRESREVVGHLAGG